MLVFLDESGDSGLQDRQGASTYFVVALIVFEDHEEAGECDQKINDVREKMKLPADYEFHFYHNSDRVRREFLEAIARSGFIYFAFILNKDPKKLWGEGFRHKESLYKMAARFVFENAKPYLNDAIVVVDKSGRRVFSTELASYLKSRMNAPGQQLIRKVKMQRSESNNLLQVADYVAGIVNRQVQGKKRGDEYFRYIAHAEMHRQMWPK